MDFQTLPYLYVTISFLLEICFLGPTHPTFSDDVTNFTFFYFEVFADMLCVMLWVVVNVVVSLNEWF